MNVVFKNKTLRFSERGVGHTGDGEESSGALRDVFGKERRRGSLGHRGRGFVLARWKGSLKGLG